jgi:outer membrane lipoprotein SlyB
MKKVILSLAIIAALTVVSCKQTNEAMSNIDAPADSTAVQVDSVKVDSTKVDSVKVVAPTTAPAATPAN